MNIDRGNQELIGEFIGAFAGDGNYCMDKDYRHQIRITINAEDEAYVSDLAKVMEKLCGKAPWRHTIKPDNVTILRFLSRPLINFIREYLTWTGKKTGTVHLTNFDILDPSFLVGFLRGLMDTDGYINIKQHRAQFCTISPDLALDIENSLKKLGIVYHTSILNDKRVGRKPTYRTAVTRDFEKFISIVNPKHFNYLTADTKLVSALVV